jgi:asparagine synthase (glutamine-hydrolysing)
VFAGHVSADVGATRYEINLNKGVVRSEQRLYCNLKHPHPRVFCNQYTNDIHAVTQNHFYFSDDTNYSVLFRGRIDNVAGSKDTQNWAEEFHHAFVENGLNCPIAFHGEFSVAIFNANTQHTILMRDRFGVVPLFYSINKQCHAFSTSCVALKKMPYVSLEKDISWVQRYLFKNFSAVSSSHTPYKNIFKVPAGHVVELEGERVKNISSYHAWKDNAPEAKTTDPKYVSQHQILLANAIAKRTPAHDPIIVETSGGLDSGTILAMLARDHDNPLISVSSVHHSQEADLIATCNDQANVTARYAEPITLDSIDDTIRLEIDSLGYLSCQGIEVQLSIYSKVRDETDARTIYSGFGGDEVITNMGDRRVMEEFDKGYYFQLWSLIPGHPLKRPLRFVKALFNKGRDPRFSSNILAILETFKKTNLLHPEVANQSDLLERQRKAFMKWADYRSINQEIIDYGLPNPLVQNRLETHTLMADTFGMDFQWPFFDQELVQNYLSTPSIEKLGPKTQRRYLHRRAVKGLVPDIIVEKNDKSAGEHIRTNDGWDEFRRFWISKIERMEASFNSEITHLVDWAKLYSMREVLVANLGLPVGQNDMNAMDGAFKLYSLNIWYHSDENV